MKDALVIIPAFNEEEAIGTLLEQLSEAGVSAFADILVINDASGDKTSYIVKHHEGVLLITHVFNLGYGSALQLGYKYAVRGGYQYVIQLDADGQHDVVNVKRLYDRLHEKNADGRYPDIVIGSRFTANSQSFYISPIKRVSISFFRWLIKRVTGQTILDPTSGLQGLSRAAFLNYSIYQNFDYEYPDANMLIQMLLLGFVIEEIPSVMHPRVTGISMHSGIIKPILYMITMPLSIAAIFLRNRQKKLKRTVTW